MVVGEVDPHEHQGGQDDQHRADDDGDLLLGGDDEDDARREDQYARDMDMSLADRFVGMYVNERTLDYGPDGREAVLKLPCA